MAGRMYFAYGSNVSVAQMETRCPRAVAVGRATLPGWRWLIMSRGYASITRDAHASVEGLLWELTESDERSLDRYEGVGEGLYTKALVEVMQPGGGPVEAFVYVSPDTTPGRPIAGYLERIIAAAKVQDFPAGWVTRLEEWLKQ